CFAVALLTGMYLGYRTNGSAYDWMTQNTAVQSATPESVIVAIDEATFEKRSGPRNRRSILTEALHKIAPAQPKAVAIDIILHDEGDPAEDTRLEEAMASTPGLILPCDLVNGKWEEPLARFRKHASGIGEVNLEGVGDIKRTIPLEAVAPGDRRWALSL